MVLRIRSHFHLTPKGVGFLVREVCNQVYALLLDITDITKETPLLSLPAEGRPSLILISP